MSLLAWGRDLHLGLFSKVGLMASSLVPTHSLLECGGRHIGTQKMGSNRERDTLERLEL